MPCNALKTNCNYCVDNEFNQIETDDMIRKRFIVSNN